MPREKHDDSSGRPSGARDDDYREDVEASDTPAQDEGGPLGVIIHGKTDEGGDGKSEEGEG